MAATISVRTLNAQWDTVRGQGLANFLTDLQAVAQIVKQTIQLFLGEWFLDLSTGTPMFQSILGVASTSQGVALLLRQRILSCPYVTGVQNAAINYATGGRAYSYSCTVQTPFGTITLSVQLTPGSNAIVTTTTN